MGSDSDSYGNMEYPGPQDPEVLAGYLLHSDRAYSSTPRTVPFFIDLERPVVAGHELAEGYSPAYKLKDLLVHAAQRAADASGASYASRFIYGAARADTYFGGDTVAHGKMMRKGDEALLDCLRPLVQSEHPKVQAVASELFRTFLTRAPLSQTEWQTLAHALAEGENYVPAYALMHRLEKHGLGGLSVAQFRLLFRMKSLCNLDQRDEFLALLRVYPDLTFYEEGIGRVDEGCRADIDRFLAHAEYARDDRQSEDAFWNFLRGEIAAIDLPSQSIRR